MTKRTLSSSLVARLLLLVASLALASPGTAAATPPVVGVEPQLSLDQAYRHALRTNPSLAVLRERVVQAEAARYRAWSLLKPTASFQGAYTRQQEVLIDFFAGIPPDRLEQLGIPVTGPIAFQLANQFSFQLVGNLPLFRGPAYPRISGARTAVEAARLREVRTRQDFLLRVAQAYYLVVTREDAVRALEKKLAVDRKHLGAARARLEVGQAPRTEVMRADLVATQDEQNLLAQRNALQAARRALALLIGVPGSPEVERPPEPGSSSISEAEMVAVAQSWRLDLRAADLSIRVAETGVKAVWMSFLPTLDFTAAYRWTQAAGFAGRQGLWNVMLTLNVPIYDAGQRYADLRDAHSREVEAQQQQRALRLDIETELVRLRSDLASATAGVVSARKALALARTTLEDMEASFQVGAATQLDVLDASQRLLDANLQLTSSLYNRDLSRLALLHAQGRFDPLREQR